MGILVHYIRSVSKINTLFDLAGIIAFGAIVYTGVALIYPPIRMTSRQLLRPVYFSLAG